MPPDPHIGARPGSKPAPLGPTPVYDKYTIRTRQQDIARVTSLLNLFRDGLANAYAARTAHVLELGRIYSRPSSIVIEVAPETDHTALGAALLALLPDHRISLPRAD